MALSSSTETFSSSPLLMGLAVEVIGLTCFGLTPVVQSKAPLDIIQELFDSLATEDLDPIVTEDEMDEIGLA